VEVLRLQRQKSDLELKLTDVRSQYYVQAREALSKANAEVDMVSAILKGRQDSVTRLTVKSPVRGIVKNIKVTTIGGVIPPNGELMEIVPVDDHLLIETRLSPRDIAFIHPNQEALVKITAYDYAIYGGLHGVVETISRTPFRTRPSRRCFITGCLSAPARITWSIRRAGISRLCRG
jgi:adhesin transport system membrane fusion protein